MTRIADVLAPARFPDESFAAYRIRRKGANAAVKKYLRGELTRPSVVFEELFDGVYAIPQTWTKEGPIKHVRAKGVTKVRDAETQADAGEGSVAAPVDGEAQQQEAAPPAAEDNRPVDSQPAAEGGV